VIIHLLATAGPDFIRPHVDWHALAPEIILTATIVVALLIDVSTGEQSRWTASSVASVGMLAALIPVISLFASDHARSMFGGGYVVDDFALVLKGLFLVAGYLTVLLSTNTIAEGDYAEGEYYLLILSSVLGMTVMASSRDLISIFIALEMLSIPAYLLAGWRKRTLTGNEAGMKYYLMGVFATAVMLYGMSLIYGGTGTTILSHIGLQLQSPGGFAHKPVAVLGIVFTLVGFGFKVSAVPFHNWAPDTYEGAPTPVTAFLSVASKAAGFVAILELVFVGFFGRADIIRPMMFVLAVLTMSVGNVIALRQTNIVRLFAYSSVAQAGFILAPLAVVGSGQGGSISANDHRVISSIVTYLIAYTIVNLGAFAVIITVSRRLGNGEITSWGGLFTYAPGLATSMAIFLFALGGIPPAVGWWAKFQVFSSVIGGHTWIGYAMAVFMAVNSVVSLAYYLGIVRTMFMDDVPDGDTTPIQIPVPLGAVVTLCVLGTLVVGVIPGLANHIADGAAQALAFVH
jgi:NADH-quinone oxidoreductase subunit N